MKWHIVIMWSNFGQRRGKMVKKKKKAKKEKQQEFSSALSYPTKDQRPLGLQPVSVPADALVTDFLPFRGKKVTPENFNYSLYFTAFDVRDYHKIMEDFIDIFTPLNIKKAYLETYRDGYLADENTVYYAKEVLEGKGITVSGAVTPTHFSNRAKYNEFPSPTTCFTDRRGNERMAEIFRYTAEIFDEIIIDDWYFTVCKCANCVKMRHNKSWQEFRSELLFDAAKNYIINPAKGANKETRLILKVPNWMEAFYDRGYDLAKLIPEFDEIAVGVETRDYNKARLLPVYGSMLHRYIREIAGGKVKKAWFDPYSCDEKIYPEQAYQAALAGADEIILFCAGNMPTAKTRPLVESLLHNTNSIDSAAENKNIFSVPIIRKLNTYGDEKLHQYLLMLGLPGYLTPNIKAQSKGVVLTAQSAADGEQEKLFAYFLKQKKDMIITAGFAGRASKKIELKKLDKDVKAETVDVKNKKIKLDENIFLGYTVNGGKDLVTINGKYPMITLFKIKSSNVWVLNLPYTTDKILNPAKVEMPADYRYLLRMPAQVKRVFEGIFKKFGKTEKYKDKMTLFKYEI